MVYLIDGYNLLHRLGLVPGRTGPNGLGLARRRLLGLLHAARGEQTRDITVVFDAKQFPPGAPTRLNVHGIEVRFAVRYPQADDLLEELIRQAEHPRELAVVSDDHRIQQAARRRGCVTVPCEEFMDRLGQTPRDPGRNEADEPDKPGVVSEDEGEFWRQTFARLDDDPAMRELFDIPWSDPDKPIDWS